MLSLDSPQWSELEHAYGNAGDIPVLLLALKRLTSPDGESEPWPTLWSALAHQGDVYSASFAAVPHVISALSSAPERAGEAYFQFPAWVEICRVKSEVEVPSDLSTAYFAALSELPALVASAQNQLRKGSFARCALAAIAAANGHTTLAEAVLEFEPDVAEDFMEWLSDR